MFDTILVGLTTLTFVLIWLPDSRAWKFCYAVLFGLGLATSVFDYYSIAVMVGLGALLYIYQRGAKFGLVAGVLAALIGLALGMHVVPGFNNFMYLDEVKLSGGSAVFDLWFNFDKSMFGLFVLAIVLHKQLIRSWDDLKIAIAKSLPIALPGILLVYLLGWSTGYSVVDWTPAFVFFPWALKNIVFTVLAEEVFFRGMLQGELSKRIKGKYAGHVAVWVAAILFGLAHFAGGAPYVLLSSLAGAVYGYTYMVTGRIEAPIATHFILNAGHFLIFSYPYALS